MSGAALVQSLAQVPVGLPQAQMKFRLPAMVSDSRSSAFHGACWSGYAGFGEPFGDGATLWFYGARWAKDWLPALVQGYRSARRAADLQAEPPAALNYPTR